MPVAAPRTSRSGLCCLLRVAAEAEMVSRAAAQRVDVARTPPPFRPPEVDPPS